MGKASGLGPSLTPGRVGPSVSPQQRRQQPSGQRIERRQTGSYSRLAQARTQTRQSPRKQLARVRVRTVCTHTHTPRQSFETTTCPYQIYERPSTGTYIDRGSPTGPRKLFIGSNYFKESRRFYEFSGDGPNLTEPVWFPACRRGSLTPLRSFSIRQSQALRRSSPHPFIWPPICRWDANGLAGRRAR
jgi:hypothetical protein